MAVCKPFRFFSGMHKIKVSLLTGLLLLLVMTTIAYAHATVLWCYIENNTVFVEAFFMGGNKVQNGKIFVVDKDGKKLLEGITDKEGLFQFVSPVQDDITIVLRIDTGHGADFKLIKQDFLDAAQEAAAPKTQ